jgi:putative toxin-antitoxin system antitoxin component (TIGR02293 family)
MAASAKPSTKPISKPKSKPREKQGVSEQVNRYISEGASPYLLTWAILGGRDFMVEEPVSALEYLSASNHGIPKQAVINLAEIMNLPMKDIAVLLNTLGRKSDTDMLDSLSSSISIEIAQVMAKGLSLFEDRDKLKRWLYTENRALQGRKPFDILNTPTGIKMVNRVLTRIEEGVYT